MGLFGGSRESSNPQWQAEVDSLKGRVTELEAALAALAAEFHASQVHASQVPTSDAPTTAQPSSVVNGDEPWLDEVRGELARGRRVSAVKMYRDHTGAGLAEAYRAVEAMS